MKQIRIYIVDDHPLVSEGLKNMLDKEEGIEVLGSATTGESALKEIAELLPDIVFLDINLPDISGIDLCKTIRTNHKTVQCLALSTFGERSYISHMMENGAAGYLLKNASRENILTAIQQVANGGMYVHLDHPVSTLQPQTPAPFITRREKEVLDLIADGLTNQQIADKLFVSITTINTHRKNLLMKFNVSNTAALVKVALKQGQI